MSYIKVEQTFCKIYFLASDVKEQQKCECNMAAFKDNQAQIKKWLKASATSTALAS